MTRILYLTYFAVVIAMSMVSMSWAATYYISPQGADHNSGTSTESPWATFAHADSQLQPGDTVLIMDGTYDQKIITHHAGSSGGGYITYKAIHDYQVILAPTVDTGESTIQVFSCPGCGSNNPIQEYLKFEGIIARGIGEHAAMWVASADDATEAEMTNNIIVRKCGFFGSVVQSNNVAFDIGNNLRDSLFEDFFAYGFGRKAVSVFGCLRVIMRRGVMRYDFWLGDEYKPNDPRTTFSGYNTQDSVFENLIALDNATNPPGYYGELSGFAASGNETPAFLSGSKRNKYLGLMVINNRGNGVDVDGGSGSPNENLVFKDILVWGTTEQGYGATVQANDDGSRYSYMTIGNCDAAGFRLDPSPRAPITNEFITNVFSTGNTGDAFTYSPSQISSFDNNSSTNIGENDERPALKPQYAPDISQRFLDPVMVAGHERGARIVNRYINGSLTSTRLWPWPDEDIIKQHMCNPTDLALVHRSNPNDRQFVGRPGWCDTDKTLTAYIWEFDGATCPTDICTGTSVAPIITSILLSE